MEDRQQGDSGTTGLKYILSASKTDTMKTTFGLVLFFVEVWMVLGTAKDWGPGKMETHLEVLNNHTFLDHNQMDGDEQHSQRKDALTSAEEEPWPALDRWKLLEKNANFGFNLFRKIAMKHDGNIVFSPFCLSFAMATLLLAARGQTRSQIIEGLNWQDLSSTETTLLPSFFKELKDNISQNEELALLKGSFAFIHKDFDVKETFFNLSKRYFDMEYVPVNFRNATEAKSVMNHYVNKETKGKIPKLFEQIDSEAKLILVDYIFFSGKWLSAFDPLLTEVETFHLDKYRTTKVPMMYRSDKFASTFDRNLHCQVLKLPYRGNASMLVVLVDKMGDHLAIEDYLTVELVDEWIRNMKTRKTDVFFPKFKLDQKYEVQELLKQMGMRAIFSPWADLSELSGPARNLKVSKILQRTVIDVNERGTEAAAGTASEIVAYSMPTIIRIDRPFHFMIYEETSKSLLFLGRVADPSLL
ncbi:LOW QUALITY PROTEIN: protein Z-dependent protease inhibitor [Trichosurus vulpecula]|uniref:LOW QUALITY PROTEIN: protein Z-dependent protease inhibitor n=1 Tax=Trichosurus vulpecula TaxID=9337 RepID=UPI00186B16CB|nr:LOW QUALITY PROTEIN: protein Z-dependent protease inhibitor [Trichosurus vulpecula]